MVALAPENQRAMTDTSLVRRLTTILAIDVVAFSAMSARDEERALALLALRLDSAGTLVRQHRGRVFKMTGDGLLAEFASPVEAVRAAHEIQVAMRSANAGAKADDRLILRIGINLGDVVESGDDLMGDAVNVAVRLESISAPGGICISSSVQEQIVGKLMLAAEDIGEQDPFLPPRIGVVADLRQEIDRLPELLGTRPQDRDQLVQAAHGRQRRRDQSRLPGRGEPTGEFLRLCRTRTGGFSSRRAFVLAVHSAGASLPLAGRRSTVSAAA